MYKIDLPVDNSEALAVERRRVAEAARKSRIFNAKSRVMGLDLHALDHQVAERREREQIEKEREKAYDSLRVINDRMLVQGQREEEERRRQEMQELIRYRATCQRPEDARDADLTFNHHEALALHPPTQVSRLGPASMQVFEGEDKGHKNRRKAQLEDLGRQLKAQREDTERHNQRQKYQELQLDLALVQRDLKSVQMHALEEEGKRAERRALSNINLALAQEQAAKQRQQSEKDKGASMAEIHHMVTSDILTERPEAAEIPGAPGRGARVLTDRWRGMTADQRSLFLREQKQQCQEREAQRELERRRELAWNQERMDQAKALEEDERRTRELERQKRMDMDRQNQQLAQEQQMHQQYLVKQLYTNQPTDLYFTQFNTGSR